MNKSEYLTGVGGAYDAGVADAQAKLAKQDYGGAYAAGFDGYFIQPSIRSSVIDAASRGWDDGAAGVAKNNVPTLSLPFGADNVVTDLKQTYDFAYDLGKLETAGSRKTSYVGWVAAAAALLLGVGVIYAVKKKDAAEAYANPRRGSGFIDEKGSGNWTLYFESDSPKKIHLWHHKSMKTAIEDAIKTQKKTDVFIIIMNRGGREVVEVAPGGKVTRKS